MHIKPVFIFGCQRSGTTMLASQLGAGADCIAFPEMQFVIWLVSKQFRKNHSAEVAYERLAGDFRFRASGLRVDRAEFVKHYQSGDLADLILNIVAQNVPEDKQTGTLYWFEHNPENRGYVELLMAVFPEARFIHCVRDPRAVYLSMRDNPRWRVADPLKFSRVWSEAVAKGYLYSTKYPDQVMTVFYDSYVLNARQSLFTICDFIGVHFDAAMLNGNGVRLPEFTRYQHAKTRGPAVSAQRNRWQDILSNREVSIIDSQCYDWMLHYGYIEGERKNIRIRYYEKLFYLVKGGLSLMRSKLTTLYQNRAHS